MSNNRTEFGIIHFIPGVMRALPAVKRENPRYAIAIEKALNERRNDGPPGVGAPFDTWADQYRIFTEEPPEGVAEADFRNGLRNKPGAHFRLVSETGIATAWRPLCSGYHDHGEHAARDLWAPLLVAYGVLKVYPDKIVGKELSRDVAELPPALRSIFQKCGDPTNANLIRLVSEVPAEERGNLSVLMAARYLGTYAVRQAAIQWHRHKRHAREAAYLDGLLRIEDFPMPAARPA